MIFSFLTVLVLGGEKNHTCSTTPSQKENAMEMNNDIFLFHKERSRTEPKYPWHWAGADSVVREIS